MDRWDRSDERRRGKHLAWQQDTDVLVRVYSPPLKKQKHTITRTRMKRDGKDQLGCSMARSYAQPISCHHVCMTCLCGTYKRFAVL